jgi:hypothetical protein
MAELSGQQILESGAKVHTELVDVSKWIPEGSVRIRKMSLEAHDAYEKSLLKITVKGNKVTQEPDIGNRTAKLLVWVICDEEGRLHYGPKDIDALGKKADGPMLRHVHEAAAKLNGLDKSIEDIAKNSEPTQPSNSDSD